MPFFRKAAFAVLVLTIVVGLTPLMWCEWSYSAQRIEPLAVPFTLKKGEYVSPPFVAARGEQYSIQIYFLPVHSTLNLGWKVVNDHGEVLASGNCQEAPAGNAVLLGFYTPRSRSAERIILSVHDEENFETTLYVWLAKYDSEGAGYSYLFSMAWAALFIVAGIVGFVAQRVIERSERENLTDIKL
jgi:hypothetical protein